MPSKRKDWQWAIRGDDGYYTWPKMDRAQALELCDPGNRVVRVTIVEVAPKKGAGR